MAQGQQYDEQGNLIDPNAGGSEPVYDFWNPAPGSAPSITPNTESPTITIGGQEMPNVTGQTATPTPAPSTGAPQLPEFGMGGMNMPPAPTFDQPSDESLVHSSNGLSQEDQAVRKGAESIFGSDPGAPGGRYSGGSGRKANPLRDSDVGKRFMGASKAGTAYGNAFDQEGLMGGGKNAKLAGGDDAELGGQPSDLLLQMLQLLGQG